MLHRLAGVLAASLVCLTCAWGCGDDGTKSKDVEALDEDPLLGPLRELEAESLRPAEVRFRNGFPTSVAGKFASKGDNAVERAHGFIDAHQKLYGQTGDSLVLRARRTSGPSDESVLLYQTYEGLEVWGGQIAVHLSDGYVVSTIGQLLTAATELGLVPAITARQALELLREALERPDAKASDESVLVVYAPALEPAEDSSDEAPPGPPRLAWRIVLDDGQYIVAADSGEIVAQSPHQHAEPKPLDLKIWTWVPTGPNSGTGVDAADESGIKPDYASDGEVATLFDAAADVWSEYAELGISGWDGEGAQMEVLIHEDIADQGGAVWSAFYGAIAFSDEFTAKDVLGHEYTHAVVNFHSNLIYHGASGALNESLADTMGNLIEDEDWLCVEDAPVGALRNQADPPEFGDPDMVWAYVQTNADEGGVHTNSGIINKASFLLTDGGTHNGVKVVGVGRARSLQLHAALVTGLTPHSGFLEARDLAVALSEDWASETDATTWTMANACAVRNAFAAVKLGYPLDKDCDGTLDGDDFDDDNDGVPDGSDNCVGVPNPSQKNSGLWDLQGDACDTDDDNDGIHNAKDNCGLPNPHQHDTDKDGIGDACDDADGDGIDDDVDNCSSEANPEQTDSDDDGLGDACEPDYDGDGFFGNEDDNCPFAKNADQADDDADGLGDACDPCVGVDSPAPSWTAGNPELGIDPQPFLPDTDGDGTPDACDDDSLLRAPKGVRVDGKPHTVEIVPAESGAEQAQSSIPLPICDGECDEWLEHWSVELELGEAPDGVLMYVRDDEGRLVARSGPPYTKDSRASRLRFAPQGGRRYRLYADLPSAFPGASFTITGQAGTQLPPLPHCEADSDCDDAGDCTADSCDSGQCSHVLIDLDGDGYASTDLGDCGDDCADEDDAIHPGAPDGCGGGDEDCDGAEDEDELVTCYEDLDDDGFGSDVTLTDCGACPTGYVLAGGDCFDNASRAGHGNQVFPGQAAFFSDTYCVGADCSYDYDCDGVETLELESTFSACSLQATCEGMGWVAAVPACGVPGRYQPCTGTAGPCTPGGLTSPTQACH